MSRIQKSVSKEATSRCGHVAVNYGSYIIVWGGYSSDNIYEYYQPANEVWVYSTENKLWYCMKTDLSLCPMEVSGASACCHGDNLYVFGGHGDEGNSNRLYRLDLKTYTWYSLDPDVSPSPRDKAVSWFYDKKFYCFSGFGPSTSGFLSDHGVYVEDSESLMWPRRGWNNQLVVYNTEEREWTNPSCQGMVPLPRAATAAALIASDVFIFGGRHKSTRMNDLHRLDLDTLTWSGEIRTTGCVPCGRSWHSLTALPYHRIFLYGGFDQKNVPLSDGWILDTKSLLWCQLEFLPDHRPRLWHTANLTPDGDIIIFGGCCNNILDSSTENEITADIIRIQIRPYSLLKICLDTVYTQRSLTEQFWSELPQSLSHLLYTRHKLQEAITDTTDEDQNINAPGLACAIS